MARGSIVKRSGSYAIVYYVEGRQKWKTVGKDKKQAECALRAIMGAIDRGEYREVPNITFSELAEKWLNLKQGQIRPKTFASYKPHVERLKAVFGQHKVKSITQEAVETFAVELSEKEGIAPATVSRCLTLAKAIFRKGVQWSYLARNPAEFVKKPKVPKPEMDFLMPEEIKKLIEATDERYRTLIMFACLTGCRQSEILGLRWSDVDFESGRVFIRQTLQGGAFYEPKSEKSKRAVVIPPILVEELKVHQLRQMAELEANPYDLVFPNSVGKPKHGRNLTQRVLEPALKVAGIRKVGFHALRHSYVSLLVNGGENIKFIQKQVGHSSAQVTWDIYSHLFPEGEKEAVLRLENVLFDSEERIKNPHS